jgi:hypothetical protein
MFVHLRLVSRAIALFSLLAVAACGGGGGGGAGDPAQAGGMSVSPTSLAFTAQSNGATPPSQKLTISVTASDAAFVVAGVPAGTALPSWLTISVLNAPGSPQFSIAIVSTALTPGTRTATLRMGIARADETLIAYRDVPVTYTVTSKLSATPAALSFTRFIGGSPAAAQTLDLSDNGGRTYAWNTSVSYESGSGWLTLGPAGGGSLPSTLSVGVDPGTAPGTYSASITVSGNGDSVAVPVSYSVRVPGLVPSQANVTFGAVSAQPSLPTPLSVPIATENGLTVPYASAVTYGPGASGWLVTTGTSAPGTLSIAPSTTNLAPGTYTATVTLTPSSGAAAVTIGATYTLTAAALSTNPASVAFSIDGASTATSTYLNRTAGTSSTGPALAWTASSSVPWLTVTPTGNSGDTATLSLVPAELQALDSGALPATVTFTYSGAYVTNAVRSLPVTLNLALPKVNYVAPYVALAGTSEPVTIRGNGFLGAAGQNVMFGSSSESSYKVVSDTEIRVNHPALTAGTFAASVSNQLGLNRTRANLVVADASAFAYAAVATSVTGDRLIYDAERRAVYVNGSDRLQRFRLVSGTWSADSLSIASLRDIALTPDGREIIAISTSTLYHIDPVALTVIDTKPLSSTVVGAAGLHDFFRIAMPNDGNALVILGDQWTIANRYNVLTKSFAGVNGWPTIYSARPTSSADGSRILIRPFGLSPPPHMYYLDVSSGQFVETAAPSGAYYASYDRIGMNSLVGTTVYDMSFAPLGSTNNLNFGVISPRGGRGYGFVPGAPAGGTLHVYDLKSPSGGGFAEIGTGIAVPDSPGGVFYTYPMLGIASDGGAVFVIGNQHFIVQPVPVEP